MSNSTAGKYLCFIFVVLLGRGISEQLHGGRFEIEDQSLTQFRGCFIQSSHLGGCLELRPGFIQLSDKNKDVLVRYRDLTNDMFYFQVLHNVFIGNKSLPIPSDTKVRSRKRDKGHVKKLRLKHQGIKVSKTRKKRFADLFFKSLSDLHSIKEFSPLCYVSLALQENITYHVKSDNLHLILRQFHVMCLSLFSPDKGMDSDYAPSRKNTTFHDDNLSWKSGFADVNISQELSNTLKAKTASRGKMDKRLTRKHKIQRRNGVDISSNPFDNDCLGMCGPGCKCVKSVCGNCSFYRWCYGHDLCCREDYMSTWCLLPFVYLSGSCEDSFFHECLQYNKR